MYIYQFAKLPFNIDMMTIDEIRRLNLSLLKKEFRTYVKIARLAHTDAAYLTQIMSTKTKRNMGDELARSLELGCNKPVGWMDQFHNNNSRESPPDYVVNGTQSAHNESQFTQTIIDETAWKALSPKARAFVEDFLINASNNNLTDTKISLMHSLMDELRNTPK
jgi:hypothetical protein